MTIVLLPGLHGTDGLFKSMIESKPAQYNIKIITYSTEIKEDYSTLTHNILSTLQQINEPYIIVAESFSGPLALFIATHNPKNLKALILVATFITAPNYKIAQYLPWSLGFSLTKPLYMIRKMFTNKSNKSFIDATSIELQRTKPKILANRIHSVFNVNAKNALRLCTLPIAYFRGIHDFIVPEKNLKEILTVRNDISIYNFECQHFILQAKAKEAWNKIIEFHEKVVGRKEIL